MILKYFKNDDYSHSCKYNAIFPFFFTQNFLILPKYDDGIYLILKFCTGNFIDISIL